MAYCPKCGYKLRLIDYKPECPKCGVNLMYYNMEERLAADADKAEAEHVKLQPKIDRIKAASVGSKYSIARLVLLFVPIGMLFLPLVQVSANIPFSSIGTTNVSILNLIMDVVASLNFDVLLKMFSSDMVGGAFICYALSIIFLLLAVVMCVLNLVFVVLSCSPKGIKRNITISSLGIVFTLLSTVTFIIMNSKFNSLFGSIYSGKLSFGPFLVIFGFLLLIGINVLYKKKNIQVKYTDVSEYLARIGKGSVATEEEIKAQEEAESNEEPATAGA